MKIRVEADGTIELDVNGSDADAAVKLIRRLQNETAPAAPPRPLDSAGLTPMQAETYRILAECGDGCHYTAVQAKLGLTPAAANSRCQYLVHLGYAERIRAGVYRAVTH